MVGLVLNDQIRRLELLEPAGDGLHRTDGHLAALEWVAGRD